MKFLLAFPPHVLLLLVLVFGFYGIANLATGPTLKSPSVTTPSATTLSSASPSAVATYPVIEVHRPSALILISKTSYALQEIARESKSKALSLLHTDGINIICSSSSSPSSLPEFTPLANPEIFTVAQEYLEKVKKEFLSIWDRTTRDGDRWDTMGDRAKELMKRIEDTYTGWNSSEITSFLAYYNSHRRASFARMEDRWKHARDKSLIHARIAQKQALRMYKQMHLSKPAMKLKRSGKRYLTWSPHKREVFVQESKRAVTGAKVLIKSGLYRVQNWLERYNAGI